MVLLTVQAEGREREVLGQLARSADPARSIGELELQPRAEGDAGDLQVADEELLLVEDEVGLDLAAADDLQGLTLGEALQALAGADPRLARGW
jgi:hypothetical protein